MLCNKRNGAEKTQSHDPDGLEEVLCSDYSTNSEGMFSILHSNPFVSARIGVAIMNNQSDVSPVKSERFVEH